MARYNIYSSNGATIRYNGAPKYNGVFGQPSYLEFAEIASPTPIAWAVGDYVDYNRTGFRYKLYSEPQVVKSSTRTESGDAFVYKNVKFYCATKDLELALFRDIVEYDNSIHFSSIPNVDTYENVYGIANRIQANMDDYANGRWNITVMSTSDSELSALLSSVKAFSLSDGTCLDALNQIYSLWSGIGWIYSVVNGVNTITLGRPNLQSSANTTPEFSYGHGNGLKVLTRAVSTKNEIATRVYAYGSERNMPTRYYNNITPHIKDYESVYIPHLMLPLSDWGSTGGYKDARLAYLQNSSAVSKYGLIPKVLRFDGTGDLDEIYPSVEGMTIGDVCDSNYPSTGYSSSERIDEIKSATNPSDSGMYTDDSLKIKGVTASGSISSFTRAYTTVANQEAVTIGNESPIFDTRTYDQQLNLGGTSGRFVIDMGDLHGTVHGSNGSMAESLTEVPKTFIEVYVDGHLETSQEAIVTTTKIGGASDFGFRCENIKFTTTHGGYVLVFIRIEMRFTPNAPAMTLTFSVEDAVIQAKVEYTIDKTFTVKLKQIGFDLNKMGVVASNGIGTLNMKTGWCAGRDFVINKATYNDIGNYWTLECQRQDDTSLMQYFPNNVYTIDAGDRFVITDIQMPTKYVTAAQTRLRSAASKALARMSSPKRVFTPEVDSKEILLSSVSLVEGLYMPVYDTDLITASSYTTWVLIDSVTIAENESAIPIYSVTLRDEKVESMFQVLTGELNATRKRLRDDDMDKVRIPAQDDSAAVLVPTTVGVRIIAESTLFVSDAEGNYDGQTITLTALTSGLNIPNYQWYYKVTTTVEDVTTEEWVALSGQAKQGYIVEADSLIYFQDDRTYEDFKVVVIEGDISSSPDPSTLPTYDDTIRISKGGRGPKGEDGDPGVDGANGWSYATITLYQRFPTGAASDYPVGNTTYNFSTNTITGTLNGWSTSVNPNESGYIYVTHADVKTDDITTPVSITGGWVTNGGDWSLPVRLTGDNGLIGKVMRGVNIYSQYGLGNANNPIDYQGRSDVDTSHIYYDVVKYNDTLYYCENYQSSGGTPARRIIPGTDSNVWVEATHFDFVATDVLLATNAYIDVLSGNGMYLYGNDGPGSQNPNVVAGMQGGEVDGHGDPQINFFAGTSFNPESPSQDDVRPEDAPFRVDYQGNMYATTGHIGGYNYSSDGFTYRFSPPGTSDGYNSSYKNTRFEINYRVQGQSDYVIASTEGPGSSAGVQDAVLCVRSSLYNRPAIIAYGDIKRNGESVVTSVEGVSGQVLRVAKVTQAEYNAIVDTDATTLYIIVG